MSHVFPRHGHISAPIAVSGEGCYLIDSNGKRYLDGSGGAAVSCLGHNDADVKAAIMEQLDPLINVLKEKVVNAFKNIVKQIGAEALIGLASGGVGAFISGIKKAFGGFKLVSVSYTHLTLPTNREV